MSGNNNILEFFVRMKDLMSSGLTKLAQNSKKVFSSVQSDIDKTVAQNKKLADSFEQVERKASSSGGSIMNWGRRLGIAFGAGAIMAGAGAFMKSSAQAYMKYEATGKSFEVLSGNKGIGQALTGELNSLQQNTILGPEVFKQAQTMMGFGIGAEKVVPYMKMLGDVAMGDAEKLGSLTLAFSQVQAAGKLTGQDLLQFINAGFNPLNEISKQTGISLGVLKEKMSEGGISAAMITKAFESATGQGGLFHNMMDQMAETSAGKMAQLEGGVEALKIAIGERMKPAIGSFIGGLTAVVNTSRKWFEIPLEKKLTDQISQIRTLQLELTSSNTTHERQVAILRELEQINPNIVKGISDQNIEYGKLAENINAVTTALQQKIFLEQFDKDNADTITKYAKAQDELAKNTGKVLSLVAKADPALAQRTDLTLGQKQIMAKDLLQRRINADPNKGYVTERMDGQWIKKMSADADLYNQIQGHIGRANKNVATINELNPDVASINKTKQVIQDQINGVLGIKSMTSAASIANNGGKGGGGGSSSPGAGSSVASGITGGGPRVVNINGVKFTDKIEIHAASMAEGGEELERKLEQMFLRILNSGANVQ